MLGINHNFQLRYIIYLYSYNLILATSRFDMCGFVRSHTTEDYLSFCGLKAFKFPSSSRVWSTAGNLCCTNGSSAPCFKPLQEIGFLGP